MSDAGCCRILPCRSTQNRWTRIWKKHGGKELKQQHKKRWEARVAADAGDLIISPVTVWDDFLHKVYDLGDVLADSGEDVRGKNLRTQRVSHVVFDEGGVVVLLVYSHLEPPCLCGTRPPSIWAEWRRSSSPSPDCQTVCPTSQPAGPWRSPAAPFGERTV